VQRRNGGKGAPHGRRVDPVAGQRVATACGPTRGSASPLTVALRSSDR